MNNSSNEFTELLGPNNHPCRVSECVRAVMSCSVVGSLPWAVGTVVSGSDNDISSLFAFLGSLGTTSRRRTPSLITLREVAL